MENTKNINKQYIKSRKQKNIKNEKSLKFEMIQHSDYD